MDEEGKKRFKQDLESLHDDAYKVEMAPDEKNIFLGLIGLMERMHEDTQMAHLRIDHRKGELEEMRNSLDSLSDKIAIMTDKITTLTKSQNGLIRLFNDNISAQNRQMDSIHRYAKRVTIYVVAISLISLIGTFGSLKGASVASAIWTVIGKLIV